MESPAPGRASVGRDDAAGEGVNPGDRPRRILVVRLGAIGDCLRVLPSLARLREGFPEAEIGWAVADLAAPVLEGHPALTRLHVLERREMKAGLLPAWRELRRLGQELAAHRYDVAIDFHTRLKSGYLVRASRAPLRIGLDRRSGTEANFLFTNCHVSLPDVLENRVRRFARLLAPLGLDPALSEVSRGLWINEAARARGLAMHERAGRPPVVIFAGTSASRAHDRWPVAKWTEAVRRLGAEGLRSMVVWGPGEQETAARIAAAAPDCVAVAPPTTLPEMAALVGAFRVYVGTNTAALHMAWMQGVPAVVLAGGRPWRTDRPLEPVRSVMLSAGGVEPARKLRGEAARRAIEGIAVDDVVGAAVALVRDADEAGRRGASPPVRGSCSTGAGRDDPDAILRRDPTLP